MGPFIAIHQHKMMKTTTLLVTLAVLASVRSEKYLIEVEGQGDAELDEGRRSGDDAGRRSGDDKGRRSGDDAGRRSGDDAGRRSGDDAGRRIVGGRRSGDDA